jgi:hypothetical protein
MTCDEVISGLRCLTDKDFGDNVPQKLYDLAEAVPKLSSPERVIPELFGVMERFPDAELGTPGPLVHTLECLDYVRELVASIRRRPSPHAVWMVNRILNTDLVEADRRFYLDLLESIAAHPDATESARDQARSFIELQAS